MMIKQVIKTTLSVMLVSFSVGMFERMTRYSCEGNIWVDELEVFSYFMWALTYVVAFHIAVNRIRSFRVQLSLGIVTSLLFTAQVFFANNFWRYLSLRALLGWDIPLSYGVLLKEDLFYTDYFGAFRYPVLFLTMLLLCGIKMTVSHPRVQQWYEDRCSAAEQRRYCEELKQMTLKDVYEEAVDDYRNDRLREYLAVATVSKEELISVIEAENDPLLIKTLFEQYGDVLSRDEYIRYRTIYRDVLTAFLEEQRAYYNAATAGLPISCAALDSRFDLTETEKNLKNIKGRVLCRYYMSI